MARNTVRYCLSSIVTEIESTVCCALFAFPGNKCEKCHADSGDAGNAGKFIYPNELRFEGRKSPRGTLIRFCCTKEIVSTDGILMSADSVISDPAFS